MVALLGLLAGTWVVASDVDAWWLEFGSARWTVAWIRWQWAANVCGASCLLTGGHRGRLYASACRCRVAAASLAEARRLVNEPTAQYLSTPLSIGSWVPDIVPEPSPASQATTSETSSGAIKSWGSLPLLLEGGFSGIGAKLFR